MPEPKIKICGLTRREDAIEAVRAGVDYLGVVLVPGSPRARTPQEARRVVSGLGVPAVLVVAGMAVERVVETAETVGASVLQLHGDETPEQAAALGREGPWSVWKAIRVKAVGDVLRGLEAYRHAVDGVLLDGWHPTRKGGAGASFSWTRVGAVRDRFPPDLLLAAAGGLTPENVGEAIRRLRPHVVDVSSGVEVAPGIKSPELLAAFVRSARSELGTEAT
ncbi:N-(5'-phosphoribosyl)anthranilate isomerase [Gemmatimonadota bacterium]